MKQEILTVLIPLKSAFVKYTLIALSLLAPIKIFIILVGLFIFLDTCFGVWSAKKLNKKITSSRLAKFISKALIYNLVVITAYILDINLLGEFALLFLSIPLAITKIAVIALIINELYSIDEKVVNVKGYGLWSMFKKVLNLAKFLKKEKDEIL